MKKQIPKKYASARLAALLAMTELAVFILHYLATYIFPSNALMYISTFMYELSSAALPIIVGASAFAIGAYSSPRDAFIFMAAPAFAPLLYNIPAQYMSYVMSGYLSEEAIMIAILIAILYAVLFYAESALYFAIMYYATGALSRARGERAERILVEISDESVIDLGKPAALSIFIAASLRFLYSLVLEIIDTVSFLIRYTGTYRTGEIIYIVVRYAWILAMLIICILAAHHAKRRTAASAFENKDTVKE